MADTHIEQYGWSFLGGLTSTGPTVISGTTTLGTGTTLTTPTITNPTVTTGTFSNPAITGVAPVAFTSGTSLALTQALHANRVVYVTDVAAAYTLPAATGTGDLYTIVLGATQTAASTIKVASSADTMIGNATLYQDGGASVNGFSAVAGDDTVDLLGTSNSTGGMLGALYQFRDVAATLWHVNIVSDAGGTEATPFSATV